MSGAQKASTGFVLREKCRKTHDDEARLANSMPLSSLVVERLTQPTLHQRHALHAHVSIPEEPPGEPLIHPELTFRPYAFGCRVGRQSLKGIEAE